MQKILHQIWVGPYEMPDREKFFTNEIRENHPDLEYRLWTNDNLPELPENLKAVYDKFGTQKDYAHQADVLRVFLVKEFGGIYLDVDFKLVNGFDRSLFDYEGFFCYHGGNDWTMPNGIFGGSKDSKIMNFLFEQITPKTGWYGPSWLGDTVKKYFELERETDHSIVDEKLTSINVKYLPFQTLEREMIRHLALYSWGPENKKKFEEGNINYIKY